MHSPSPVAFFKRPVETKPDDYQEVAGRRLYCTQTGQGDALVLLHGFPDHGGNMARLFYGLAPNKRVIAYDRSGSGLSDKPPLPYTLDFHVEELRALLDQLQLKQVTLLGHSIGGTLGIFFAAKYPERVKALVLLNAVFHDFRIQTGMSYLGAWWMKRFLIGEAMLCFHNRLSTRECLKLAFLDRNKITPEMIESYHFPFQLQGGKASYLKTMRSIYVMSDQDVLAHINSVKRKSLPVQVLWTEKDWSMPLADGKILAERINATFQVIPNCGHSPHLELDDPCLEESVLKPIRQFLTQIGCD